MTCQRQWCEPLVTRALEAACEIATRMSCPLSRLLDLTCFAFISMDFLKKTDCLQSIVFNDSVSSNLQYHVCM